MDKHAIFDHLIKTNQQVGYLNNSKVTTEKDASIISGYPSPVFNLVRFDTKNHTQINKLESENIPFMCFPSKEMEADFEIFAEEQRLTKIDFVIASIFKDLQIWKYIPNPLVEIRYVENTDDLLVFDKVASAAFSHQEKLAFNFLKPALKHPKIRLFIAYLNEQPVGCAMLSLVNDQAGLYWICVLSDFRKQGIGRELVEYRMNIAKELGHKTVIAQNMTPSLSLYKRLGFEQLGGLPLFLCPKQFFIF